MRAPDDETAHETAHERAARAATSYSNAKNESLVPMLRESKIKEAIKLWEGCVRSVSAEDDSTRCSLHRNLGCANIMLADLPRGGRWSKTIDGHALYRLSDESRKYHYSESTQAFAEALRLGIDAHKSQVWRDEVLARCQDAFSGFASAVRDGSLDDTLNVRALVCKMPRELSAPCMTELAQNIFHHGVKALGAAEYREAFRAFKEMERPLIEAQELCRRASADPATHTRLQELGGNAQQHLSIAESRLAVAVGDATLHEALTSHEGLETELVWRAVDKYQEAALLTRGCDVETEAVALARRGKVYAKVLRNESTARPLLLHATRLVASLAPRNFHGVPWYEECKAQLEKYQQASYEADERAAGRRRAEQLRSQQATREKLKAELTTLEQLGATSSAYKLLCHVYEAYPPKIDTFTRNAAHHLAKVKDADAGSLKKVLQTALLHYHSDKNSAGVYGMEWAVLCEEISKILNAKYDSVKADS